MITSLLLGGLVVTGQVAFWHVYLISLVNATIAAFDAPGRQSLFPMLVPRIQLQNAITLNAMLFQSGQLVGPAIAGALGAGATRTKALRDFTGSGPGRQVPQVAPAGGES